METYLIPRMFQVLGICFILTECALSLHTLLMGLCVYVFLDLSDEVAVWIPYLIK